MEEYFSIDEICKNNKFVLVDTCSFIAPSGFSVDRYSPLGERLVRANVSNENLSFWMDAISLYENIYSTENVVREIRGFKYNYKKAIKLPIVEKKDRGVVVLLRRELSHNKTNTFNLANMLEMESRIFNMNKIEKGVYDSFCEKYSFFRDKLKLSEEDFELLLLGGVLSRENKSSIISNDRGIIDSWRLFMRREGSLGDKFHFYSNTGVDIFKKIEKYS